MIKIKQAKVKLTKDQKLLKDVQEQYPELFDLVQSMSKEELEKQVLVYTAYADSTKAAVNLPKIKERLDEIKTAQDELKAKKEEIMGPINDTLKALDKKIAFLIFVMRSQNHPVIIEIDNQTSKDE